MKKSQILLSILTLISFTSLSQVVSYNEDFQNGLPLDYTIVDNDGLTVNPSVSDFSSAWHAFVDPMDPLDTIVGSTSYFEPAGQADRWLITPAITLGTFGNILYWEAMSQDASYPDGYKVLISTTTADIASFSDTVFSITGELAEWTSREVNLSDEGYNNQTVFLAFVNRTTDGFKLYLDDIKVEIEDPVALIEKNKKSFIVYPNPATNLLNVDGEGIIQLQLIDLTGRVLATTNNNYLDVKDLNSGEYLIRVESISGIQIVTFQKN